MSTVETPDNCDPFQRKIQYAYIIGIGHLVFYLLM